MTGPVVARRREFIEQLHELHRVVSSPEKNHRHLAAEARGTLARLRRSVASVQYQDQAYEFVLRHQPPESEQEVWLLVAGLFALHPQPQPGSRRIGSLGASMGALAHRRGRASDTRRFTQLLVRDQERLPHYLRQAIRLLDNTEIALDYHQLLDDLIDLMGELHSPDTAHRVRLRWAREFHRPASDGPSATNFDTPTIDLARHPETP